MLSVSFILILPISKGREGHASLLYGLLNFTFCEYQLSVLLYPIFLSFKRIQHPGGAVSQTMQAAGPPIPGS